MSSVHIAKLEDTYLYCGDTSGQIGSILLRHIKKHPVGTGCFEFTGRFLGSLTCVAQALGDAVDGGMHHCQ